MFERQLHPKLLESLPRRVSTMEPGKCWLWLGGRTGNGHRYGKWQINKKQYRAHRVVYTLLVGPIPDGLDLLHLCDTPLCCNPFHLKPGTQTENMADMDARGRRRGTFKPGDSVGERNHAAKLTQAQAVAIRNDHRKLTDIAAEYGVSPSLVSEIRNNKRWNHV